MRPRGLVVLLLLVVAGIGVGAGFFHWRGPEIEARLRRELEGAPATPEERLERWLEYGGPQIHHRLAVYGRASEEAPWLVTHVVTGGADDATPDVAFGVDASALPRDLARRDGLRVLVELPAPRALGPATLPPEAALHVPHVPASPTDADARARLRELAEWLLRDLAAALERDVPGARLEVVVGEPAG